VRFNSIKYRHLFYRCLVAAPLALPGMVMAMLGKGWFHSGPIFMFGLALAFAIPMLTIAWIDRPRKV
jgi:hypothetical protein